MRSPALPETLKVAQALVLTLLAPSFQGSLEGPVPARASSKSCRARKTCYVLKKLKERKIVVYFAAAISSTIACAAARGSVAARIGRPTTRKSAPARIASDGVAVRV